MGIVLSFLIISFFINAVLLIPFINILYKLKFRRQKQKTRDALDKPTPIFDQFNKKKEGTPIGGGFLLILSTTIIFLTSFPVLYYLWVPITSVYANKLAEVKLLLFTFISFGLIGLFDDVKKIFFGKTENFFGLRLRHKLILELVISFIISYWLYADLKIHIINIPFIGVLDMGVFFIFFAAFVITSFANAYNISDGLDGLATGVLMIALLTFWVISYSILDTTLSMFIAVWLGGIIAFLYFNIYPARIFLGDVGALSFGATFAVIGLLLGKTFSLIIIGGIFVVEIFSSLAQLVAKRFYARKLLTAAPMHLFLQHKGWNETTIVFRSWLATIVLAFIGLWLALIS